MKIRSNITKTVHHASGNKCIYYKCGKTARREKNLGLFRFPYRNKKLCDEWIANSGNTNLAGLSPLKLYAKRICAHHFEKNDFASPNRLKKSAKPIPYEEQQEYLPSTSRSLSPKVQTPLCASPSISKPHAPSTSLKQSLRNSKQALFLTTIPSAKTNPHEDNPTAKMELIFPSNNLLDTTKTVQEKCVVPGCTNNETEKNLRFYTLPYKNKEICEEWIRRAGKPKLYMQHVKNSPQTHKLCEIHFDYICKTGVNSDLHKMSLPTLYLPIVKNYTPGKNCFFTPLDSTSTVALNGEVPTTSLEDNSTTLQIGNCSKFCRICCRKGILYDIQKSMYNKEINLQSIIKSLVSHYVLNSAKSQESICLDCVKQILTCHLTIIQIESSLKVFACLLEPLNEKTLPKGRMNFKHSNGFDMKTILNDCNLVISDESIETYFPKECIKRGNMDNDTVDIPRTISKHKIEVNVHLPTMSGPVSKPKIEANVHLPKEASKNSIGASTKILNWALDTEITKRNDKEANTTILESSESSASSVKIVRVLNQELVKLPKPLQLKTLKDLAVPQNSQNTASLPNKQIQQSSDLQLLEVLPTAKCTSTETQERTFVINLPATSKNAKGTSNIQMIMSKPSADTSKDVEFTFTPRTNVNVRQYGNKRKGGALKIDSKTIIFNELKKDEMEDVEIDESSKAIAIKQERFDEDVLDGPADSIRVKDEVCTDDNEPMDGEELQAREETNNKIQDRSIHNCNEEQIFTENKATTSFQSFMCSEISCQFACETLAEYVAHIMTNNHSSTGVLRKCPDCGAICDGAKKYIQHMEVHESKSKPKRRPLYEYAHCDMTMSTKTNLVNHVASKHSELVVCPTCQKKVKKQYISKHMKRHQNEDKCMECNLQFGSMKLLKQHELAHHPKVCLICSMKFARLSSIRLHMMHHTTVWRRFACEFCQKIFKSKFTFLAHGRFREKYQSCTRANDEWIKAYNRFRIVCSICGKSVRKVRITAHMRTHALMKRFGCDQCSYRSSEKTVMLRHQLTHSGEKPFLCTKCGQAFTQKGTLDSHMKMHAISPQPIQCQFCEESFETKFDLRIHSQKHGFALHDRGRGYVYMRKYKDKKKRTGIIKSDKFSSLTMKYSCKECDKIFSRFWSLKSHIAAKHAQDSRLFECGYCPKRFDKNYKLTIHVRMEHIKRPDVTCGICQKVFISPVNLAHHMTSHTGERRYLCDLCPAKFKTPGHLSSHKFSIHENWRPFSCNLCSKAFKTKQRLKEHVRMHTGDRSKCEHCDKTFAGNSNRNKHMREVHNIRSKRVYAQSNN